MLATSSRAWQRWRADGSSACRLSRQRTFQGLAREAALKLLELTDGALVTMFESTLGFRHGPKTIINADTLVVVFVSNDPLTRAYDLDMIEELRDDGIAGAVVAISAQDDIGDTVTVSWCRAGGQTAICCFPTSFRRSCSPPCFARARTDAGHPQHERHRQPRRSGRSHPRRERDDRGARLPRRRRRRHQDGVRLHRPGRRGGRRHVKGTTYHLQVGLDGAVRALEHGIAAVCAEAGVAAADCVRLLRPARLWRGQCRRSAARAALPPPARPRSLSLRQRHGLRLGGVARLRGRHQHRRRHRLDRLWRAPGSCRARRRLGRGVQRRRVGLLDRHAGPERLFADERRPHAQGAAARGVSASPRARRRSRYLRESDGESGLERDGIAGLAPVVAEAVAAGDPAAIAIHDLAADELAAMAEALREALGFAANEPVPLSWSGGVLTNDASVRSRLEARLHAAGPYRLVKPQHPPAYGAALYAQHRARRAPD